MCIAVCYLYQGKTIINLFSEPNAKLPAKTKNDRPILVCWGRRKKEDGALPLGGWIYEEDLQKGRWNKYFPKLVKVPVIKFQENDFESRSRWFDITEGQFIQGVYLQEIHEKRLYIMVITPAMPNTIYSRWPKIINY